MKQDFIDDHPNLSEAISSVADKLSFYDNPPNEEKRPVLGSMSEQRKNGDRASVPKWYEMCKREAKYAGYAKLMKMT